jgi:hypothetical protein
MRNQRFRWELVLVPLAILGTAWFLNGIEELAFNWGDLMKALKVNNVERYSRLAVLALTLITVCAIWRVLKDPEK